MKMRGAAAPVPDDKDRFFNQGLTVNNSFVPQSLVSPERDTDDANAQDGQDAQKISQRNTVPEYQDHQMKKGKAYYRR
jgi:hypothetical protein